MYTESNDTISTSAAVDAATNTISTSAAAAGTAQYGLMYPEPNDTHGHGIKESHPPRYSARSGVVKKSMITMVNLLILMLKEIKD
jgi:hypothetical protein